MSDLVQGAAIFGNSIADAINQYHKEHVQHDQLYGGVTAMERMLWSNKSTGELVVNPPMDESGKPLNKDLISPFNTKVIESYKNFNRKDAAYTAGQLSALGRVGMDLLHHQITEPQQYPVQVPGVGNVQLTGAQAASYSVASRRPGKTTNPDLNFTHAVNAYQNQLSQLDNSLYQNYGVHPVDILQSDRHAGFTFNKDTGKYTPAPYEKADAITVNTGEGPRFFSKDQFEALKKPAEDWQKLSKSPPDRNDPRFQAPSTGGVSDAVAKANQIKADYQSGKYGTGDQARKKARAAIQSLNIPGLK